jgi:hypothetical protein
MSIWFTRQTAKTLAVLGVIVGLIAGLIVWANMSSRVADADEQLQAAKTIVALEEDDDMLVRYNCTEHRAFVRSWRWEKLDAGVKEVITKAFATTCGAETGKFQMTILDYHSGRQLASVP